MNQLHCELWQDAQKLTRMESNFKSLRVEDNKAGMSIIMSYLFARNAPAVRRHAAKMLLHYIAMCERAGLKPCLTPKEIEQIMIRRFE